MNAIVSRKQKILKVIPGLMMALLLGCGGCIVLGYIVCKYMNVPPRAPVYPNSLLVEQTSWGVGRSRWPWINADYVVSTSPEGVVAFYMERGSCKEYISRVVCRGESEPFGEYVAYIDLIPADGQTHYTLEIRWRGCDTTWELR